MFQTLLFQYSPSASLKHGTNILIQNELALELFIHNLYKYFLSLININHVCNEYLEFYVIFCEENLKVIVS